jgi:hypothetical protein
MSSQGGQHTLQGCVGPRAEVLLHAGRGINRWSCQTALPDCRLERGSFKRRSGFRSTVEPVEIHFATREG